MYENAQICHADVHIIAATITSGGGGRRRRIDDHLREMHMSIGMILLIVLILLLVGVIPAWPHSTGWGYGPSGGLGLIVLILVILLLMGKI